MTKLLPLLLCSLFFICSAAQDQDEMYLIHPEYTDQVIAELAYTPTVYRVQHTALSATLEDHIPDEEKLLAEKNDSFFLDAEVDSKTLIGTFETLGTYWVIDQDYGAFSKGSLIQDSIMKASDVSISSKQVQNCNVLIRNLEGRYYLVQPDYLKIIENTFNSQKKTRIRSKKALEKITSIAYTIEQYQQMIERCKELTANLIIHGRMAKKGLMNKKQLKTWKTDLEEAKKLNEEITTFKSLYDSKGSPLEAPLKEETTENYEDFSKMITKASKDISL